MGVSKYLFIIVTLCMGRGISPTHAQSHDTTAVNEAYLLQSDAWLSSGHVLGLKAYRYQRMSYAESFSQKAKGGFVNFYESDNSLNLGAGTASVKRLNAATVFSGKIVYQHFNGRNMGVSAFINPYKNPLDIDESADSTAGTKKMDSYHLTGSVASQLTPRWTVGAKIDYQAANYAKTKDLRHQNKLLDLEGYIGASYAAHTNLTLGAGYNYVRRIESVGFGIYGNSGRQYVSLINFGSFFGFVELHDDQGYTSETRPIVNFNHSASVFAHWKPDGGFQLFSELKYGSRAGYFGKKGSAQIVYTEHEGKLLSYHGVVSLKKTNELHHLDINLSRQTLENMQNVFRRQTSAGGISSIVYFGQNKVLQQQINEGAATYTLHLKTAHTVPLWTVKTGVSLHSRRQTVSQYPFYRKQEIHFYSWHASAQRSFLSGRNIFSIMLESGYGKGNGTARNDGRYAPPSTSQPSPGTRDNYLYREFEYLTKSRLSGGIQIGCRRLLHSGRSVYLKTNCDYTRAFEVEYLADQASVLTLSVGYTF